MLFPNKRYLLFIIVFTIFVGLLSHIILSVGEFEYILTANCLDALGLGALLAWIVSYKPLLLQQYFQIFTGVCFFLLVLLFLYYQFGQSIFIECQTIISIFTLWIIGFFVINPSRKIYGISLLLDNKVLIKLGKMSYGIYLYHFLLPYYTNPIFLAINRTLQLPKILIGSYSFYMLENFGLLLVLAFFSFKFIERPFLVWKNKLKVHSEI